MEQTIEDIIAQRLCMRLIKPTTKAVVNSAKRICRSLVTLSTLYLVSQKHVLAQM